MNRQVEQRIDRLETLIKERVASLSGYASGHTSLRYLLQLFRYSDQSDQGYISYKNFQEFMLRINLVGAINRDIEHLFNRYDEDLLGYIGYKNFANTLYGCGSCEKLNSRAFEVMAQVRQCIVSMGLQMALRFGAMQVGFENVDKRGFVSLSSTVRSLSSFLNGAISSTDLNFLLKFFDVERNNTICVDAFLREFKRCMSVDRKKLVKSAFERLDPIGNESVMTRDIERCYVLPKNTQVLCDYVMRGFELQEFLSYVESRSGSHRIPWSIFLDYYRVVSMCIDDDHYFDFYMRSSWEFDGGKASPTSISFMRGSRELLSPSFSTTSNKSSISQSAGGCIKRRVLVIHNNGDEEVVEIVDELGCTRLDGKSLLDALASMGINDVYDIRL